MLPFAQISTSDTSTRQMAGGRLKNAALSESRLVPPSFLGAERSLRNLSSLCNAQSSNGEGPASSQTHSWNHRSRRRLPPVRNCEGMNHARMIQCPKADSLIGLIERTSPDPKCGPKPERLQLSSIWRRLFSGDRAIVLSAIRGGSRGRRWQVAYVEGPCVKSSPRVDRPGNGGSGEQTGDQASIGLTTCPWTSVSRMTIVKPHCKRLTLPGEDRGHAPGGRFER